MLAPCLQATNSPCGNDAMPNGDLRAQMIPDEDLRSANRGWAAIAVL